MAAFLTVPNVLGESRIAGYVGKIEILSYSLGHQRPIDPKNGLPLGLVGPLRMRLIKQLDSSTAPLALAAANDQVQTGKTVLQVTRNYNGTERDILVAEMLQVRVDGYSLSLNAGNGRPAEEILLGYSSIQVTVITRSGPNGTVVRTGSFKYPA